MGKKQKQRLAQAEKNDNLKWILLIAFSAFLLYSNTLSHGFVGDDHGFFKNNPYVQKGISGIPKIFSTTLTEGETGQKDPGYRPLTLAFFAIQRQLSGNSPAFFHWTSVLLYSLLAVMVFAFLKKLFQSKLPAIIATLVFVVHPLHTEVVANIKSLDEILSLLFLLISLMYLLKYVETKKQVYFATSILAMTATFFAKESSVAFIALVPITLFFFTKTRWKQIGIFTLFYLPTMLLFLLVRHVVLAGAELELSMLLNTMVGAESLSVRLATSLAIFLNYFKMFFWPHPLTVDYSYATFELVTFTAWQAWGMLAIIFAGVFYVIKKFTSKNPLVFAILFFVITFSVTSNFIILIGSTFAERFMFTPLLSFSIIVGWFCSIIIEKFPPYKNAVLSVLILVGLLFSFLTIKRNADWATDEALISSMIRVSDKSARVYEVVGRNAYNKAKSERNPEQKKRLLEKSVTSLEKAYAIFDKDFRMNLLYGFALRDFGDYKKSIDILQNANSLDSTHHIIWFGLGHSYIKLGQYDAALPYLEKAYSLNNKDVALLNNLANCYEKLNCFDKAVSFYEKALQITSKNVYAHRRLVNIFSQHLDDPQKLTKYQQQLLTLENR